MRHNKPGVIKRLLSFLLCLSMVLPLIPLQLPAKAAGTQTGAGSWQWEEVSDSVREIYLAANPGADMSEDLEYDCGNGLSAGSEKSYMTIVEGANADHFSKFKAALVAEKYSKRSERSVASREESGIPNAFAEFRSPDGKVKVYTYYLPVYSEIRIIVDSQADTVEGYQYTSQTGKTVEPKVVLWGLPQAPDGHNVTHHLNWVNMVNYGAMTVILMPDNSLFIHDGGDLEQWSDEGCADFLKFCRDLTGTTTEKMVINTWALSHAHHDHFRGFWRFLYKYHDQFDLKNVMYNIDRERTGDMYDITGAMKLVREVYPEVRYYKPHTGEKITIAGVTLDILYTQEDRFVPNDNKELIIDGDDLKGGTYRDGLIDDTSLETDFNDTSTVMKFTFNSGAFNETDALLYADLNKATAIPMAVYPDSILTADIVTVPHHGQDDRSDLMSIAKNGGAKIFFQYQHKKVAYGPDGKLETRDLYGTFVTNIRDNFKKMFPEYDPDNNLYTPSPAYQVYWAGTNTVTVDMNTLGANTKDALTYEYTGWQILDDADRLLSMSGGESTGEKSGAAFKNDKKDDSAVREKGSMEMRFDVVDDKDKLYSFAYYAIQHKKTGYVMSYSPVADTPGKPNQASSLIEADLSNLSGKGTGYYYYNAKRDSIYIENSNLDAVAWILRQSGKKADSPQLTQDGIQPQFKTDGHIRAYEQTYFAKAVKGDDNKYGKNEVFNAYECFGNTVDFWQSVAGKDGDKTQYRYMDISAGYDNNWVTTSSVNDITDEAKRQKYVIECIGRDTYYYTNDKGVTEEWKAAKFLVYWYNTKIITDKEAADYNQYRTSYYFLTCDEDGHWGIREYEYSNKTESTSKKECLKLAQDDVANNTLYFYSFTSWNDKYDNRLNVGYSIDNTVFNVEEGTTQKELLEYIQNNANLHVTNVGRKNLDIACSGTEQVVNHYFFQIEDSAGNIVPFDSNTSGREKFTVKVRYHAEDGYNVTLTTLTVNVYKRNLALTGTKTYTVPLNIEDSVLRDRIVSGITVSQTFTNTQGNMSAAENVSYSAIPEAGKYWLEFLPGSNGNITYIVNVNYRRTNGSDILVDKLSVVEQIEFEAPAVLEGYVAKNSGVAAAVMDAEGNPITFQINGQTVELTLGMLSQIGGQFIDTTVEATHENLVLKYRNQYVCENFKLTVTASDIAQDNPDQGEPGYVDINKQSTTLETDFYKDGVGSIELSTYGIPFEKGVDLILIMDLSGSMLYSMDGEQGLKEDRYEETRMYAMQQSLLDMVKTLQESGSDIRIAMSDFGDLDHFTFDGAVVDRTIEKDQLFDANYSGAKYPNTYEFSNHLNHIFSYDGHPNEENARQDKPFGTSLHVFNKASHKYTGGHDPYIYTGSGMVGANAFVDVSTLYNGSKYTADMGVILKQLKENVKKGIGTNYDVGLEYAYHLGYAVRQDNISKGEDRDIVCIFMSDGAPMQYNYFSGHSGSQAWADWIGGTVDEAATVAGKNPDIQSITYSETGKNAPIGLDKLQEDLLDLLNAGTLVRPEYQREYWTGWVYEKKTYAEAVDNDHRSRAYDLTDGYFLYRMRYDREGDVNFFEFMDHQGYELDWDYLCRIAWANGIEDFDFEYYQQNPALPELVELLTNDTAYLGYERVTVKDDAGNTTGYEYHEVRRSRLIDPGLQEAQYYPKYEGNSKDFFTAAKSLGIDCTWDYFTQIAYKNRDSLTDFIALMKRYDANVTNGQTAMTAFVNLLYTHQFSDDSYWATLSPYAYFYNKQGKNWWAEAIKGDPSSLYPVINKYAELEDQSDRPYAYNGDVTNYYDIDGDQIGDRYISGFQGLGIELYSILFATAADGDTDSDSSEDDLGDGDGSGVESAGDTTPEPGVGGTWDNLLYVPPIMQEISSNNGSTTGSYYYLASSQRQLTAAFTSIAGTMSECATKAYYTDTIGDNYDLYYGTNAEPTVKFMQYALDADGNRVGEPVELESITFETQDGAPVAAYSNMVENGAVNILREDGVVYGRYVIYNTNTLESGKAVNLQLDDPARQFELQPETFYWIIGNIGSSEMVLGYQVKLLESVKLENTHGQKVYYLANEAAKLSYVNYLGNPASQEIPREDQPRYPWVTVQENSMNVDKTVEKTDSPDKFKLTLEAFGTGSSILNPVSKPMDVVLVLDQSATMYTPVGIDAESISINNLSSVRNQLQGKAISFNANNVTIQENAKTLGYYVAIHNTYDYIYIVQYAQNAAGEWGWYYVPVDETTRTVSVDTASATPDTDVALAKGKLNGVYQPYGYGTYAQPTKAALTNVSYYQTQYGTLHDTLQEFVGDLKEEADNSGLDHRVAVVGFASPYYDDIPGSEGTGIYVDGSYNIFGAISNNQIYSDALVSIKDEAGYRSVMNSVMAYQANYQQTCPSIGISIAQSIFGARTGTDNLFTNPSLVDKLNTPPSYGTAYDEDQEDEHLKSTYTKDNAQDRDEIMILFTDGIPTVRCSSERAMGESHNHAVYQEFWTQAAGIDDVIDHAYDAKQAGIQIYCIGTSSAVKNNGTLEHISSNDPTAQSQLTVNENWVKDSRGQYYLASATAVENITGSSDQNLGYTMYTSDADMDLSKAFKTVYESIDSSVQLTDTAVLKEVISDYFDLTTVDSVKVYTADFTGQSDAGSYQFGEKELWNDASVSFTSSNGSDRNDTILVSGFNYKDEYVGFIAGKAHGKKLIVELEIEAKEGFWGGNNVPTNEDTTGIYMEDDSPVVYFPMPEVNVAMEHSMLTKDQTVYYGSKVDGTGMVEKIIVDGVEVHIGADGTMTPAEAWMDDYATLSWTEEYTTPGTTLVSSQMDGLYPFCVTLAPIYSGAQNMSAKPSNMAGTKLNPSHATAEAQVYVLIPVITWKDTVIKLGEELNESYYASNNLVRMTWVHQPWMEEQMPQMKVDTVTVPGFDEASATYPNPNPTNIPVPGEAAPTLTYHYSVNGKPIEDVALEVKVLLDGTDITEGAYFMWENCNYEFGNHLADRNQIIIHRGSTVSREFYVHVEGGDVLLSDKTVTPVDGTENIYELNMEGTVTGSVTEIDITRPTDVVLVLDHSGSMHTPVGASGVLTNDHLYDEVGHLTVDGLDETKGAHMGYYVAQSKATKSWFIIQYANGLWNFYLVPSTQSIVNPNPDSYTEHTKVLSWTRSALKTNQDAKNLVYYYSQYAVLYDTVLNFVDGLRESGVDHTVSLVGFAGPNSQGSRLYVSGYNSRTQEYETNFKSFNAMYHANTSDARRAELFHMAMKNVQDDTQYAELLNNIASIETNHSYTSISSGLKLTDDLLNYNQTNRDGYRGRTVVLFTDGIPNRSVQDWVSDQNDDKTGINGGTSSKLTQDQIYDEIIAMTNKIKKSASQGGHGATVYCVSPSTMLTTSDNGSNTTEFLMYASSDYPNATSMNETGEPVSAQLKYVYQVDSADDFELVFDTVSEQVGGTKVQLDETAILRDTLSDYFELAGMVGGVPDVRVYMQKYLGSNTWADLEEITDPKIKITLSSSDGVRIDDVIEVTGFNYSEQYLSEQGTERTVTLADGTRTVVEDYMGSRLVVKVRIKPLDDFWGDATVPTNESNSGIFGANGEELTIFPIPETEIPAKYLVQADSVVVDFGLPVIIDVAFNDTVPEMAVATLKGALASGQLDQLYGKVHNEAYLPQVQSAHGKLTLVDGKLCYTPTDMKMDREENFIYEMEYKAERDDSFLYNYTTVTVIPASTIYYEDNFLEFQYYGSDFEYHDNDTAIAWKPVGEEIDSSQAQDRPGAGLSQIDANNIYGYDQAYTDVTSYSNGAAHKIRVYEGLSGVANFTFTGTGFDVIGLTSNTTGTIAVSVTNSKGEFVAGYMVDTYYGYSFVDGQWVVNPDAANSLYQVPVIKVDLNRVMTVADDPATEDVDETEYVSYGYDTYTVEIDVSYSDWLDHGQCNCENADCTGCYEFYLDAIRIYNPAGVGGSNSQVVQDAYVSDGEGWPVYQELRNMFITQKELEQEETEGVIFIDGKEQPEIGDYKTWGPNNEVYLAPGQSIAFTLNALNYVKSFEQGSFDSTLIASIQLGMRGINAPGQVKVTAGTGENATVLNADLSATDMFYNVTNMMNKVVTVTNNGETAIAISSFKITHTEDPTGGNAESGVMSLRSLPTVSLDAAATALEILTPEVLADPVLTPKYPALSFEGMVSYNVFFTAEDLGSLNGADLGLAVFDSYNPEGTVENAKDVIMGATQIDGLYMVATNGVHAKYLGDTQYFRAFAKKADGSYVYSKMVSYSALDYAENVLAKSNDVKLKQLVVAMLNYGSEAQKFFGYKTDDLMNKNLTVDEQALVSGIHAGSLNAVGKVDASKVGIFASTGGFAKKYPAISFKGAFEINYFMAPSNAVDGDMTLYCWNEDTYNGATRLTADNADRVVTMTLENGLYTASSDQIAAKDLDETVYVAAVYESNGISYCSGVLPYSIAAYCRKPSADVADLANAAAVYGCAAKEFFGV